LECNLSLEIHVENAPDPNIEKFQNQIIKSVDSKKRNIVIEDKMKALVKFYIDENNVDLSYDVACFIYNLFEEGHDLNLGDLNNTSYVFIVKNEFEKANALLKEAMKKIKSETLETEEIGSAALVIYNAGVVAVAEINLDKALKLFQSTLVYFEEHEQVEDSAGALLVVEKKNDEISLKEMQAKDTKSNSLSIISAAKENIVILKNHLIQKI
jgi:tetratricopeptide (TPR) repeat protein